MELSMLRWETFPALDLPGFHHAFSLRTPAIPDAGLAARLHPSIQALGWHEVAIVEAEQPHGREVAYVTEADAGKTIPGVDALVTDRPGVVLALRAADCGPIYLLDPVRRALGVVHSGRKGTDLDILGATVAALREKCGSDPANLVVFLGPCIRPPYYDVDFPAAIARQAAEAGVQNYQDAGITTAADLGRYYSYRAEKGQTGRMWAVAMLANSH